MEKQLSPERRAFPLTLRDFFAILFRHLSLVVLTFLGIFLATVLFVMTRPTIYQAEMKILVKRERVDPVMTSEPNVPARLGPVSDQELNSEIELLHSRDLLEKVAFASGLHELPEDDSWWARLLPVQRRGTADVKTRIAQAGLKLEQKLQVKPLLKSNLIEVSFESSNPELAARILSKLADLYLQKHLEVHRPARALEFFQGETERYRKGLADIEVRLTSFRQQEGTMSPQLEKEITLNKVTEFEAKSRETEATIAETNGRIRAFESEATSTSPRLTTQVRRLDNRQLVQQLKSTLLNLELKRIELLQTFKPTYLPVQEVDKQIAGTRAAIAAEENVSARDEVTDLNPTHQMLKAELAKAKSELSGLNDRAKSLTDVISAYRGKLRRLEQQEMVQHDLVRAQKMAEENFQLYLRKQEEARISDAMDRQRILNVAIAEAPTVPLLASNSDEWKLTVFLGVVLATLVSLALAFASEYQHRSFQTPKDLESFLGIPVVAAIPKRIN